MRLFFAVVILLLSTSLFAAKENKEAKKAELRDSLILINEQLQEQSKKIQKSNIWIERFKAKKELQDTKEELKLLETEISKLWRKKDLESKAQLTENLKKKDVLKSKLELLESYAVSGYDALHIIDELAPHPSVANPFAIFIAISYLKDVSNKRNEYNSKLNQLSNTIEILKENLSLLIQKYELVRTIDDYKTNEIEGIEKEIFEMQSMISDFEPIFQIFSTSFSIFNKKASEVEIELNSKIKTQTIKLINILIIIAIFIGFVFLVKFGLKRYLTDTERFYIVNKTINFITVIIIVFIVTFNYISNLTYILTILGFVSAGLAFAMKEWFMSILGWFVIILGGYIHVGDRIRILKDGDELVGDVLEISFTRIALYEDVTLPTYLKNRRAGRIIFIPNNYIFTNMIQNYSFDGLKTVWDGIDIMLTFESNHKKAVQIAREIATKYSKGYSDMTRKQMAILKSKYNLKSGSVEPRVFSLIEEYGMKISTWYLTNSFATLTLRSMISTEIIEAYMAADDIEIAYPTKTIHIAGNEVKEFENKELIEAIVRKSEIREK